MFFLICSRHSVYDGIFGRGLYFTLHNEIYGNHLKKFLVEETPILIFNNWFKEIWKGGIFFLKRLVLKMPTPLLDYTAKAQSQGSNTLTPF